MERMHQPSPTDKEIREAVLTIEKVMQRLPSKIHKLSEINKEDLELLQ